MKEQPAHLSNSHQHQPRDNIDEDHGPVTVLVDSLIFTVIMIKTRISRLFIGAQYSDRNANQLATLLHLVACHTQHVVW